MKFFQPKSYFYVIILVILLVIFAYQVYQANFSQTIGQVSQLETIQRDIKKIETLQKKFSGDVLDNKFIREMKGYGEWPLQPATNGKPNPFALPLQPEENLLNQKPANTR